MRIHSLILNLLFFVDPVQPVEVQPTVEKVRFKIPLKRKAPGTVSDQHQEHQIVRTSNIEGKLDFEELSMMPLPAYDIPSNNAIRELERQVEVRKNEIIYFKAATAMSL